ncbi:RidA family protein [Tuanshanicoccus lijuaniae]|uniref:RidA family protein n=1 Tax=Aerococcaceae bacterium zg-1292 TaxID=2774330 RepID=UPI001935B70E|nr:RidA family protein [Aerococcaceae bacterium zg-1292]MBF6625872.1 RidA family protein [Aerococcaceae bacterium zg-BR9]MBS4455552.1 RidA family protein [Aerococcaceae bacterium zg-A91]MBS4457171.1 RidA family protein [Aerococcaceae bacterium zg-BR33]QQA37828.1 RidA family protein [Aerococcaceae bacterium zg-1292]
MKKLETSKAPAAVGPYSQGIQTGNLFYLSGQLGLNPETGKLVEGGVQAQAKQAFENIKHVLASEGLTLDNVVKVLVLLADIQDFAAVNDVYATQFNEPYPARSAFAVAALPLGGLIEIEVIAERGE